MNIKFDFYLIDDHSMAVMIFEGKTIYKRSQTLENIIGCGILPLWIDTNKHKVLTTGLRWNISIFF